MKVAILAAVAVFSVAAAAPNWPVTVRAKADGAYVMGNPAAKVKLVEYLSYTCSHCAEFVGQSRTALKRDYVARGLVSIEARNAVRDRFDFAAALLARCGGPAKFFGNAEAIMAAQGQWLARAATFAQPTTPGQSIDASLKLIATGVGLDAIMKRRGFTARQIDACLIDKKAQAAVTGMTNEAWNVRKIPGTPTFVVNGVQTGGHWATIEPQLKQAAGI